MASTEIAFAFVALDTAGKRVRGVVAAATEGFAYEQLKRQGLAPVTIRRDRSAGLRGPAPLNDREAAAFLADLAALLEARSDIRTALSVIGAKAERPAIAELCRAISLEVGSGGSLERAFSRGLGERHAHVAALVAAGESSGALAAAMARAANMLSSRVRLRDQLISVLSYPTFVLLTAVLAFSAILLFVIPSLAPLVRQPGAPPSGILGAMIALSDLLRANLTVLVGGAGAGILTVVVLAKLGALTSFWERLVLRGPFRRTAASLIYGGFTISLGDMLTGGAPMAEALRLASRAVRSNLARRDIERVGQSVRQGKRLSDSLSAVSGAPPSIIRLAAVGEASGALGAMLSRAGKLEEEAALRRIEGFGRLIGPAVIVILGGLIALLMGGLLTSITHIGDAALGSD